MEIFLLWCLLTICGVLSVACQGFLVREACVRVLVGGAVFLLSSFEDLGCFSGCLMSSAGIQKLFCGIYSALTCSFDEFVEEKVVSLSYSSAILGPPLSFFNNAAVHGIAIHNNAAVHLMLQSMGSQRVRHD